MQSQKSNNKLVKIYLWFISQKINYLNIQRVSISQLKKKQPNNLIVKMNKSYDRRFIKKFQIQYK